jgi:transmembrane sensor
MPEKDHLKDLIELLLSNRIASGQMRELAQAMDDPAFMEGLDAVLRDSYYQHGDTTGDSMEDALKYMEVLRQRMQTVPPKRPARLFYMTSWVPAARWTVAALLLLAVSGAAYWYSIRKNTPPGETALVPHFGGEVQPGGNKAILTLGDHSTITLDDAQNGQLASQGGSSVIKKGGALLYNAVGKDTGRPGNPAPAIIYNTITTPAGGQYRLVLADGTAVWLDSKSSIRFPTAFHGGSRDVEVTGQVYLEVAPYPGKPFNVRVKDQVAEVLGTRFNINAFDNEQGIKTTLADGALRVRQGDHTLLLHPAEQAREDARGSLELVRKPDMAETFAWKDGLFHFSGTDIASIMRQVARWYDVDIRYDEAVQGSFVADIPRNVPLSQVLQLLELTGHVHFRIDGKKIIVSLNKQSTM